jgi:hypothetical protein
MMNYSSVQLSFIVIICSIKHFAVACPFNQRSSLDSSSSADAGRRKLQNTFVPSGCAKTNGALLVPTKTDTCSAYLGINQDFQALVPAGATTATRIARADIFAKAVRLAFHE